MKIYRQNRTLSAAIALSVLAHGALLAVRIVAPEALKSHPADPGLEVILVNAKHDKKPIKAEALAQVNLDGGGNADAGRAKSPLPDLHRSEDGDNLKEAQRRVEELELDQDRMLAQVVKQKSFVTPSIADIEKPRDSNARPDAVDKIDNEKAIKRREAEIAKSIEDYNKRPKKTMITPSTREVGYAQYYNAVKTRIEKVGTSHFPEKDGKKLFGVLLIYIPIFLDGNIYKKEGVRVEHSSGNRALDKAALRIVENSAPFDFFPPEMRKADNEVFGMVYTFKFTHDEVLQAELRGESN